MGGWGQQPRPGQGLLGSASLDAGEAKLPLLHKATLGGPACSHTWTTGMYSYRTSASGQGGPGLPWVGEESRACWVGVGLSWCEAGDKLRSLILVQGGGTRRERPPLWGSHQTQPPTFIGLPRYCGGQGQQRRAGPPGGRGAHSKSPPHPSRQPGGPVVCADAQGCPAAGTFLKRG